VNIASNTGPLIALAKVDLLPLLKNLYGRVHIPRAVYRELMAKSGEEANRLDAALSDFLTVDDAVEITPNIQVVAGTLGAGEQFAIALAHSRSLALLIDDCAGRVAAKSIGISVTGTVGVLLAGKAAGKIPAVLAMIHRMRDQGYWISDELIVEAAKLAGELPV
jgi:predicted nucleic acid-binding protein